jgi:hypothetical protein
VIVDRLLSEFAVLLANPRYKLLGVVAAVGASVGEQFGRVHA